MGRRLELVDVTNGYDLGGKLERNTITPDYARGHIRAFSEFQVVEYSLQQQGAKEKYGAQNPLSYRPFLEVLVARGA